MDIPRKLTLPGGHHAGMNGSQAVWWEDLWNYYVWNPYGQDGISAKPAWITVVDAADKGKIANLKKQLTRYFSRETEQRICQGYGETNRNDENALRIDALKPGALTAVTDKVTAGDTERTRLKTRYQAIKTWITGLDNLTALQNVSLIDAGYWGETWTAPED